MMKIVETYGYVILEAFGVTLLSSVAGILVAMVVGLPIAICLQSRFSWICAAARGYVEFMRGSPLLLLLFLVYYGGPSLGVTLDAITVGVLGLGFYGAAFYAEIFRAGMASVPPGQVEAARVLGFPSSSILTRIEIPQMLPLIVPPMAGQAIVILKESSVLSIITVGELTKMITQISNETFTVTAPFLLAALMYWLAAESISTFGRVLVRSFTSPGLRP